MLTIDGPFHECVTLVKHLIMFPGCGLRLRCDHAQLGFDQRQLWAIIEKRIDSWATNASNRHLIATGPYVFVGIYLKTTRHGCIKAREYWKQQYSHLLDALFERTFFDTTYLQLWINHDHGAEAFLPIVDSFRGFVNLEKLSVVNDSLLKLLFPLLQQGNPVLLPALKSLYFYDVKFQRSSDSIL